MGKLILVRHGRTSLNRPGKQERLRAWLDVPLSEEGLEEAEVCAQVVQRYTVETIFSSCLQRALQTAEAVGRQTRAPIVPAKSLRPWNLGVFAGQKVFELLPFLNLLNMQPKVVAPGGESFFQFYERYAAYLGKLLVLAEQSTQSIVAVTHVRNILATPTILKGSDPHQIPVSGGPPTGSIVVLEKEGDRWNLQLDAGTASDTPIAAPMELAS